MLRSYKQLNRRIDKHGEKLAQIYAKIDSIQNSVKCSKPKEWESNNGKPASTVTSNTNIASTTKRKNLTPFSASSCFRNTAIASKPDAIFNFNNGYNFQFIATDGENIYGTQWNKKDITVISALSGYHVTKITIPSTENLRGLAIKPNSNKLYVVTNDAALYELNTNGSEIKMAAKFSTGARGIYLHEYEVFVTIHYNNSIAVWNSKTKQKRHIYLHIYLGDLCATSAGWAVNDYGQNRIAFYSQNWKPEAYIEMSNLGTYNIICSKCGDTLVANRDYLYIVTKHGKTIVYTKQKAEFRDVAVFGNYYYLLTYIGEVLRIPVSQMP